MEWLCVAAGSLLIVFGAPIYEIVLLIQLHQQQKRHFEELQRDLSLLSKQLEKQHATVNAAHKIAQPTASPTTSPADAPVAEPAITRKAPVPKLPEIAWAIPDEDRTTRDRNLKKIEDPISVAPPSIKTQPKPITTGSLMEQRGHHLPDPTPALPVSAPPRTPGKFETSAKEALGKIWSWIVVGEEQMPAGVSMEYAMASQWLLRLGILILVIGVGFFLKYSFDNDLIKPIGRVAIAAVAGLGLLTIGVRLLGHRYHLFGQGLMGGGLAMLYFSVYAANHFYHLIDDVPSFVLMGLITVLAGGISVQFNSMLVAVLGILGGYGTPLMLSTGAVDFVSLYAYLLLLGVGVLMVCYWKNWPLVNLLSFVCTYTLFFTTMRQYEVSQFWHVMPFLIAFFVLFSAMIILYKLVNKTPSHLLDLAALILNSVIFFSVSYQLVTQAYGKEWVAAVTIGLALFFSIHVYAFLAKKLVDRELLVSFLGLASFFVIVTVPLVLSSQWITVSWALLALVLLWIAKQLGSRTLKYVSFLLYAIVLFRFAVIDLPNQFATALEAETLWSAYWPKMIERFVIFGVPVLSLGAAHWLSGSVQSSSTAGVSQDNDLPEIVPGDWAPRALLGIGVGMLALYLHLELNRSIGFAYPLLRLPSLTCLWLVICGLLLWEGLVRQSRNLLTAVTLGLTAVLLKLFFWDLPAWSLTNQLLYFGEYSFHHAAFRLLDFGSVIAFLGLASAMVAGKPRDKDVAVIFAVSSMGVLFVFLTLETNSLLATFLKEMRAGGVSILWSVFAFCWLLQGIWRDFRPLRFAGLILFAIVIVKVFFSDLAKLDSFWRIIAFLVLGMMVIAGSFIYLKYQETFTIQPDKPTESAVEPN